MSSILGLTRTDDMKRNTYKMSRLSLLYVQGLKGLDSNTCNLR